MRAIYKFPLPFGPFCTGDVAMPVGAHIRRASVQYGAPTLWAEAENTAQLVARRFSIIATGETMPDDAVYVATYDEGDYVWHIIEHRPGGQDAERPWIEWTGGDCPVDGREVVEYEMRNDDTAVPSPAGVLDWSRDDEHPQDWDIVRYRKALEQPGA